VPPTRVDAAHFSPDTRSFIELLHVHGVRYLIVGGEAVIFHGHVRLTGDVDFFVDPAPENLERLHAAVSAFWDGDIPGRITSEDFRPDGTVVQFGLPPNRIDLMNSIGPLRFDDVWPQRVEAVLALEREEIPLPYIGLDDLIECKRTVGRPQDLADIEFLAKQRD
jgi:hypothetical protein